MTRRRRRHQRRGSPPAPPPPPSLENDDLLREILLCIPPQPSSLPRASAVCRRWRRVAVDPKFTARFRAHHGKPPLLGFSQRRDDGIVFAPVLDAPDRVPPERLDLRIRDVTLRPTSSGAATAASSSSTWRGRRSLCAIPSRASSAAWPSRRSSRRATSTGRCSALTAARATCTAAAAPARSRWSWCSCAATIIDPSHASTPPRSTHGAISSRQRLHTQVRLVAVVLRASLLAMFFTGR
ncbi:uncharacterized protein [Triticum aestivum]|uniref:uncharacterized protein n=1 Tax=Triticum aestivum TaxID=4565 RepID=UPI001D0166EF|nr:uncharacterized protein LOC123187325 [Triticum aestivum]